MRVPEDRQVAAYLKPQRAAFTLVELTVVMAIIGVLVAITIPAVMSARDASRRVECLNRLRQFGLALHEYESTHGHLPSDNEPLPGMPGYAFGRPAQVKLLPYLEQAPLYQSIVSEGDHVAIDQRLPVFHCPSDDVAVGINYRTCSGRNATYGQRHSPTDGDAGSGPFTFADIGTPTRLAEITDGLSMTAAMSERVISRGAGQAYDPARDIWLSDAVALGFDTNVRSADDAVTACQVANGNPGPFYTNRAGRNFAFEGLSDSSYNHVLAPNSRLVDCSLRNPGAPPQDPNLPFEFLIHDGVVGARSQHRDRTVNVLLMDGSARTVPQSVDIELWRGLASRSDSDQALQW